MRRSWTWQRATLAGFINPFDMTSKNQLQLARCMLARPPSSCSWDDMVNHPDDLVWNRQQAHAGELRCCVDSIGLTLAFLELPPAEWQQLEREFGAAAVAFRFLVLSTDIDAFLKSPAAAHQVRFYMDAPVVPPAPPVDPFDAVMKSIEATVTKAAASVEGKIRVRPLLNEDKSLQLLVIPSTIVARDRLHQLPAFRKEMERLRDRLRKDKIKLRSVSIEAQEVIDRIDHLITAEDILRKGEAPQLRLDQGLWGAVRQLWLF
jgi:hypothetical protein